MVNVGVLTTFTLGLLTTLTLDVGAASPGPAFAVENDKQQASMSSISIECFKFGVFILFPFTKVLTKWRRQVFDYFWEIGWRPPRQRPYNWVAPRLMRASTKGCFGLVKIERNRQHLRLDEIASGGGRSGRAAR